MSCTWHPNSDFRRKDAEPITCHKHAYLSAHYVRVDFLEQVVLGEIRRLTKFASKYEDEQKELTDKIKTLRDAIEKSASQAVTADMFISIVRKYTRAKKLTSRMLNELVHKIEVHPRY